VLCRFSCRDLKTPVRMTYVGRVFVLCRGYFSAIYPVVCACCVHGGEVSVLTGTGTDPAGRVAYVKRRNYVCGVLCYTGLFFVLFIL